MRHRGHNPRFVKVSWQTTTRDRDKLFNGHHDLSGNANENYISVVAHFVNADWELHKRVFGLSLIETSHFCANIAERIARMVEDYGLVDKIFSCQFGQCFL